MLPSAKETGGEIEEAVEEEKDFEDQTVVETKNLINDVHTPELHAENTSVALEPDAVQGNQGEQEDQQSDQGEEVIENLPSSVQGPDEEKKEITVTIKIQDNMIKHVNVV